LLSGDRVSTPSHTKPPHENKLAGGVAAQEVSPVQHPQVSPTKPSRKRGKTLFEQKMKGVNVRHSRSCPAKSWDEEDVCDCTPTFEPWVSIKGKLVYSPQRFTNLAAAKTWRTNAEADKNRGKLRQTPKTTFAEKADELIDGMRQGRVLNRSNRPYKPKVIRDYTSALERLKLDFGPLELAAIRRKDWRAFANEKLADGLSPSRVRNLLMPAQVIYSRLIEDEDFDLPNPLAGLVKGSGGTRDRVAEPKEALELLEALSSDFDKALWATALYAGPRMGELRALKVENDHGTYLEVLHSWDDVEGEIDTKSAAGVRKIPVCDHLRGYLDIYKAGLGRESGLLFGETATQPFNYGRTTRRASKSWKDAGLKQIGLHECRHSFRSFLNAAHVPKFNADVYMGHADGSVSSRYTHLNSGVLADDAAALDAYLEGVESGVVVPLRKAS
jgi:integrase